MIATATSAEEHWHLHRSDSGNTLTYAYTTQRTLLTCDFSLSSLTLAKPEAGDYVELILLY